MYVPEGTSGGGKMKRALAYGVSFMDGQGRALALTLVPHKGRELVEASLLACYGINASTLPQQLDAHSKNVLQAVFDQVWSRAIC